MAGKKVDRSAYKKLRQDLKSGQIGQMYVFHGEEKYLMEQCVAQIRKRLVPEGMEEFNLHTFQGKENDVVFLVLGADEQSTGAAAWAMGEKNPNIMNVAATRAKKEFYIVGDKKLYLSLNSAVIHKTCKILQRFNGS